MMRPPLICPSCREPLKAADFAEPWSLQPYRICPRCAYRYTVDDATKTRQRFALLLAIAALILTAGWYLHDGFWMFSAITSYLLLAGYIWWANVRVYFVPFD